MSIWDFFKKRKEEGHYDPINIKITDIRVGSILEYNLKTWEVQEEYEYDWGNNSFSYEYKLVSDNGIIYLNIEEDDDITCIVSKKISISLIAGVLQSMEKHGMPPSEVILEGITYYRGNEKPGFFRNTETTKPEESEEFISWDYIDKTEKKSLSIEQWGEKEYEASVGIIEPESAFSNILIRD